MNPRLARRRPHTVRRPLIALALALAVAAAGAGPATGAAAYRVVLNNPDDFVAQTNFVQCVGASMQMMVNMIRPVDDRSSATQLELQQLAREWSGSRPDGRLRQGASVRGWAAGLNILGVGPYRLVGEATIEAALLTAARAIRETGKPVGLLVWRGRHAWVMSGFEATGDPLRDENAEVTRAIVLDPLYPNGSSVWGTSPKPGAALTVSQLGQQFVARRMATSSSPAWPPGSSLNSLAGQYVLVLPILPTPPEVWEQRIL